MSISPQITEIIPTFRIIEGRIIPDDNYFLIGKLTSEYLRKIALNPISYTILYLDPNDNRLWELSEGPAHNANLLELRVISREEAKIKYNYRDTQNFLV